MSSGNPFFSIVIPTRDRSDLIVETVLSALNQDNADFEIILSDNSSNVATQKALQNAGLITRINYIRPPSELNMPDHWEFASEKATGRYVLILTDRSILKQGTLKTIFDQIQKHSADKPAPICSWGWSLYDDHKKAIVANNLDYSPERVQFRDSRSFLSEFLGSQKKYPYFLPRGLNSCYSSAFAKEIRLKHGKLFTPTSPDFTSAFRLLALSEKLLFIDAALLVSRGLRQSNGGTAYIAGSPEYLKSLGEEARLRCVPLKAPMVENYIYEDYLRVQEQLSPFLSVPMPPVDFSEYFIRCYKELLTKRAYGILDSFVLESLFKEWQQTLGRQDAKIQAEVRKALRWSFNLKNKIRSLPLGSSIIELLRPRKLVESALIAGGHLNLSKPGA